MEICAMNRVLIQIFLESTFYSFYILCVCWAGTLLKCWGFFFMAKIACSLLKNKADLCLKIQMKLLLGWGSKEGIYVLWNEWHACANSRRPDISKVSDRAVYTALFPLWIQRFLPWQDLKDPWPLWGGWGGEWGLAGEN